MRSFRCSFPRISFVVLIGLAGLLGACSKSNPTNTEASGTVAPSSATTARSSEGTTATTRARSTATTRSSTGSSDRGEISTEGVCGALTVDEIESLTGETVDHASIVRGGCSWDKRPTPVVQLEVDKPTGDPATAFETRKSLYGDATAPNPGVGEDSVYAFDNEIYWLQDGTIYHLRVTGMPDDKSRDAATQLATSASSRL